MSRIILSSKNHLAPIWSTKITWLRLSLLQAVSKLQIILNHVDTSIVSKGLDEFREQILLDHGLVSRFGYMGRSIHNLQDKVENSIQGVLKEYISSSPDLEEFFALWDTPNRNEDKVLSAAHTSSIAGILYCISDDHDLSIRIISRLIRECGKSIHSQLDSGQTSLIHATLALLMGMCRTSIQTCRDSYQKILSSSEAFGNILKPGKVILWEKDNIKFETDARYLGILLLLQMLQTGDMSIITDMLGARSLWRRAINGIKKDSYDIIKLLIDGIINLFHSNNNLLPLNIKLNIIDNGFIKKIIELYQNENLLIQNLAHNFLLEYSHILSMGKHLKKGSYVNVRSQSIFLIKQLNAHINIKHREIQLKLLQHQPYLLSTCVSTISISWDPKPSPSYSYYCALSHLYHIINAVSIDSAIKTFIKSITSGSKTDEDILQYSDSIISAIIPGGK
eukprot:gene3244-6421_t